MSIGENIKNARKKAGLTQKELGDLLGIKQQAVAMFEGDKTNIKLSTVRRFANALNVTMSEIIDDNWGFFTSDEIEEDFFGRKGLYRVFNDEDWQVDIIVAKAMELSEEGRYKVIEYEDDLLLSRKYNKDK